MNDIYPRSVGVNQASICLVILTIFCHYEVFSLMEIVPLTALSKICLQLWLLKLRTICFNLFERPPAVCGPVRAVILDRASKSTYNILGLTLSLFLSLSLLAGAESGGGAGAEGGKPGGSRAGVRFLRRGERRERRERSVYITFPRGRPDATENLYQYPGLSSLFLLGT